MKKLILLVSLCLIPVGGHSNDLTKIEKSLYDRSRDLAKTVVKKRIMDFNKRDDRTPHKNAEAWIIYESLVELSNSADELLFMAALIEGESEFTNAVGKHGELGPCQIKPSTGWNYWPKMSLPQIARNLRNINFNIMTGLKMFRSWGNQNKYGFLCDYNSGKRKHAYSRNILMIYNSLLTDFRKEQAKVFQKSLSDGGLFLPGTPRLLPRQSPYHPKGTDPGETHPMAIR